jgi:N-acetylglutamate synthase/N-acetylornithine aminotransferase
MVVMNAGHANVFTGRAGLEACATTAKATDRPNLAPAASTSAQPVAFLSPTASIAQGRLNQRLQRFGR